MFGKLGFASLVGMATFAGCFSIALYVYVLVQILPPGGAWLASVVPYRGVYGPTILFSSVTYSEALEASGALSFVGLSVYSYSRNRDLAGKARVLRSLGLPLVLFGVMIAAITYVEIHLSWGEVWYGAKFANLNPRGFPWGSEQVAYNTCLVRGTFVQDVSANCQFLNYDWLLYISVLAAILGTFLGRWNWSGPSAETVANLPG